MNRIPSFLQVAPALAVDRSNVRLGSVSVFRLKSLFDGFHFDRIDHQHLRERIGFEGEAFLDVGM